MGYYETLNAIAKDMENIYKVIKEDLDKGTTFPQWAIWSFSKLTSLNGIGASSYIYPGQKLIIK